MIKYIPYNQDLGSKDAVRIVPYFVLPQFYPIFAYREAELHFYAHIWAGH